MSWSVVKLKDCCKVISGGTPKREIEGYWGGEICWVTPKDLSKRTSIYLDDTPEKITSLGLKKSSATLLPANSVLFSSRAPIGHLAITTKEMATNQGFKSLVPSENVDAKYLYYCLKYFKPAIEALGNGATFKEVSKKVVENFEIPLPPLPVQKQIAAVLEKADTLRSQCQQMEKELNSLAQSVFLDMFGDPVKNPKGWETRKLNDIVSIQSGATPSKSNDSFWKGHFPWVSPKDMKFTYISDSIDHISENVFAETNLKRVPKNTILIVVRGMILSHTVPLAITVKDVSINQDIKAMKVKDGSIESLYLLWCLKSQHDYILGRVSTAAHGTKRLDMPDLVGLDICIPPHNMQQEFIKIIKKLDELLILSKGSVSEHGLIFNSLMQRAFKGELKLKEVS